MAYTFDASNKRIILSTGTTSLDVRDMYSRWKDWMILSDNSKYQHAFEIVGGDTIDGSAGTYVPAYIFLVNGWRVRPQEANHTLNVSGGILLVSGGGDPFVNTTGSYVVRINYQQPVQAITVSIEGGGAGASITEQDKSDIAAKVLQELISDHSGISGSLADVVDAINTTINAGLEISNEDKLDIAFKVSEELVTEHNTPYSLGDQVRKIRNKLRTL